MIVRIIDACVKHRHANGLASEPSRLHRGRADVAIGTATTSGASCSLIPTCTLPVKAFPETAGPRAAVTGPVYAYPDRLDG
jgi:hypothetical protein